jgi:hypothetical protein
MTYKEKAIELVNKFDNYTSYEWWEGEEGHKENMKQCALIAVEEILQSGPTKIVWEDDNTEIPIMDEEWWESVKKEIEAL